jgi:tRNA G46 methylase TrmB
MVTDWEDYALCALEELQATEGLTNAGGRTAGGNSAGDSSAVGDSATSGFIGNSAAGGFAAPLSWRSRTGFEKKGLEKNHKVRELFFIHE